MSREKQIDEMKTALNNYFDNTPMELSFEHENGDTDIITDEKALGVIDAVTRQALIPVFCEALYNAGYRKQSEGKWVQQVSKDKNGRCFHYAPSCSMCGYVDTERQSIMALPTVDVVPKSEVEKIFEEIDNLLDIFIEREVSFAEEETSKGHYPESEAHDYAKDIIEDIRQICVTELKKKYTESCTDCKHFISCEPNPFGICNQYEKTKEKKEK